MTISGAVSGAHFGAPIWLVNALGVGTIIEIVLYLIAYIYFAVTDKDCLRSEKYSIQKLAIQRGLVGDDVTGFFRLEGQKVLKADLPESRTQTEHD